MNTTILATIQNELDDANGKRRVRTLGLRAVAQVIEETRRYGIGGCNSGTVANAYGYKAIGTRVAAVRLQDGRIVLDIGTGHASRGAGVSPRGIEWSRRRLGQCQALAEADHEHSIVMTAAEARHVCRHVCRSLARPSSWGKCPVPADLPVTVQDSIRSGNCPAETARIAANWQGQDAISAQMLWEHCRQHESITLLPFVVRALRSAEANHARA